MSCDITEQLFVCVFFLLNLYKAGMFKPLQLLKLYMEMTLKKGIFQAPNFYTSYTHYCN